MVENDRERSGGTTSSDLEYDEAHDAAAGAAPGRPGHANAPVQVATETADGVGGDYAYDLAHDVPRSSGASGTGTR